MRVFSRLCACLLGWLPVFLRESGFGGLCYNFFGKYGRNLHPHCRAGNLHRGDKMRHLNSMFDRGNSRTELRYRPVFLVRRGCVILLSNTTTLRPIFWGDFLELRSVLFFWGGFYWKHRGCVFLFRWRGDSSHELLVHVSSSSYDMHVSPPHMTCMYPPPHKTCMYPPPHMTYNSQSFLWASFHTSERGRMYVSSYSYDMRVSSSHELLVGVFPHKREGQNEKVLQQHVHL